MACNLLCDVPFKSRADGSAKHSCQASPTARFYAELYRVLVQSIVMDDPDSMLLPKLVLIGPM